MNITIINGSDTGGAGYAARNLQRGLVDIGVNAQLLTENKVVAGKGSAFSKLKRRLLVRKYINKNYGYLTNAPAGYDHFSFARSGYQHVHQHPMVTEADVLNIHWISYLIDYPTFFKHINKPVVWTLHDTNLFTGGCHYNFDCQHYIADCANCPQLAPEVSAYAASDNLQLKVDALKKFDPSQMIVVSPSKWLMELSEKSRLFGRYRHFHVPNSVDTAVFNRQDQLVSRAKAGLPADKFIVLFVSTSLAEQRKGFDVILKLKTLFADKDDVLFVAIGKNDLTDTGIHSTGYLSDKKQMAQLYNAADVFVIPSREDNLPNTMLEALCCGAPVVGFKTGGIPDAVLHGVNGFLVDKENVTNIEAYINKIRNYKDIFDRRKIAADAAKKYALTKQASAYLGIINNSFANNKGK